MADGLTPQQEKAVYDRGGKLLVSAAAGSGKTKVLVDRIMSYIKDVNSPANLDDFLVITYTKAAASELRGKIATKLGEEIALDPSNRHLQRQLQRLYLTKISTVHSYCSDVLREYAYRLDIPGDFRVAEENECKEMQYLVVEKVLEDAYKELDPDFCAFVDTQGIGRNDNQLLEIIIKLSDSARCHKDPESWLDSCLDVVNLSGITDISQTPWGEYLINDLRVYLDLHIDALTKCYASAIDCEGMAKPLENILSLIDQLCNLRNCTMWDEIVANSAIDFGRLTFPRKNIDVEMADKIKAIRESCKKSIPVKLRKFTDTSNKVISDNIQIAAAARGLIAITRRYMDEYDKLKKRRRVMDFSDLEHKTLDLLLGKNRYGPTAVADEIGQRFREVMVDEYQDSNEVQDAIFSAITHKKQNCFMVGDVKQSIYQFRLADPTIFLKKYSDYVPADIAQPGEERKVLLTKNFRSGAGVVNAVNDVFSTCMSEGVGDLYYGDDEKLYAWENHSNISENTVEFYGIDADGASYEKEARFVAKRIVELLDGTHFVTDRDQLRPICVEDIAILLRSPGSVGRYYVEALASVGIPSCTGKGTDMLETEEVQTLRAILQVIDNPQQDIPMLTVLTSKVFGFTADDLAGIRNSDRKGSIYDAVQKSGLPKAQQFVSVIKSLRNKARSSALLSLIKHVFTATKLDSIFAGMVDGENKTENLLAFYKIAADFDSNGGKSLGRFLVHVEALSQRGLTIGSEQNAAGAVTIMSIHKSKGLEFPVVFLPSLSRSFNKESARSNLLCDKNLGIGLSCVDAVNRVRYPSVPKSAISTKMLAEGLSEELRVLYVAMTRAKDRLIMTYTGQKLSEELRNYALRSEFTSTELLTREVSSPGQWILISALRRAEAGALFAAAEQPKNTIVSDTPWHIEVITDVEQLQSSAVVEAGLQNGISELAIAKMEKMLNNIYPYEVATKTPSKQTATQLKGRDKDDEIAAGTDAYRSYARTFRKPGFKEKSINSFNRGNAMHKVMQHICLSSVGSVVDVDNEINRLVSQGYITDDEKQVVDCGRIARFFNTNVGRLVLTSNEILREFKFSILKDASQIVSDVSGEKILLQGVIDCAVIEDDGITVIDFKTDRVGSDGLESAVSYYRSQVCAYAEAIGRIYQKPVKQILLYFFEPELFVQL